MAEAGRVRIKLRDVMLNGQENKGEVTYPCPWAYRVIGRGREELRQAAETALAGREGLIYHVNRSREGKYHSLHVELVVADELDRDLVFQRLRCHPAVVMVL